MIASNSLDCKCLRLYRFCAGRRDSRKDEKATGRNKKERAADHLSEGVPREARPAPFPTEAIDDPGAIRSTTRDGPNPLNACGGVL